MSAARSRGQLQAHLSVLADSVSRFTNQLNREPDKQVACERHKILQRRAIVLEMYVQILPCRTERNFFVSEQA